MCSCTSAEIELLVKKKKKWGGGGHKGHQLKE